jgi:hypothetical protein
VLGEFKIQYQNSPTVYINTLAIYIPVKFLHGIWAKKYPEILVKSHGSAVGRATGYELDD